MKDSTHDLTKDRTQALILLRVQSKSEKSVQEELKKLSEIRDVFQVFGEFDLVASVDTKNVTDLSKFVNHNIRHIPGVLKVSTLVNLSNK